ncbi:3-deoxy-D-manno-octulosonic acid kinase [Microbulbifer elongatus]|uniref:3-deoxy-D-manno-octulosonic acid kinase n=1 Tax=Microbulbifer elongatus TaxID=86173 RepID=UPI001F4A3634
MGYQQFTHRRVSVIYDDELVGSDCEKLFQPAWLARASGGGQVQRGTAVMFEYNGIQLVFKRYHRGGLAGRIVKKTYLYSPLADTRMWREFNMLREMREMGLPVTRPVAARCVSLPPAAYRGSLITERVADSQTLAEALCQGPLDEGLWEALGALIARFHRHNVYHADLNVHNILLAGGSDWYLIDFDKGAIRSPLSRQDAEGNVARLRRSLDKEAGRLPGFRFSEENWQILLDAYRANMAT